MQFGTRNANSFVDSVSIMSLNVDLRMRSSVPGMPTLLWTRGKYCVIKCGFAHAQLGTGNANSFVHSVSIMSLNVDLRMSSSVPGRPTLLWTR